MTNAVFWISFIFRSLQSIEFCMICNRFSLVIYLNIVAIVYIRHYILMKVSIHQGDMIIINIYVPSIRAPKYVTPVLRDVAVYDVAKSWTGPRTALN